MSQPTIIAKNTTASSIFLRQLRTTIAASPGQATLTDFNTVSEIQNDSALYTRVTNGDIILNNGTSDLTTIQAQNFLTQIASTQNLSAGAIVSQNQAVGLTSVPTTTSTTSVILTDMSITFTPLSSINKIHISFGGNFAGSNNACVMTVSIFVDGVAEANTQRSCGGTTNNQATSVQKWLTNLSATSHTIDIRWSVSSGTGTAVGVNRTFNVTEFSA